MEIFYKIMEVNVADYSPELDVSFIMFEARSCSRNPIVVVNNWIVLAFFDIQYSSKYSRKQEKTGTHRGRSYMWVYYIVKYVTKTASANQSEEILEIILPARQPPLSPVFVRSSNPVLLLLLLAAGSLRSGLGRGGGGG